MLELGDRAVAGEDHLLVRIVEGVEGMKQLFLSLGLVLQEMDVVDEQDVDAAVLVLEEMVLFVADCLDELVRKGLGGHVGDLEGVELRVSGVSNRLDQVCLAEADPTVDETGVGGRTGVLRDCVGGVCREGIVLSDDEGVEEVVALQVGMAALFGFFLHGSGPRLGRRILVVILCDGEGKGEPTP